MKSWDDILKIGYLDSDTFQGTFLIPYFKKNNGENLKYSKNMKSSLENIGI